MRMFQNFEFHAKRYNPVFGSVMMSMFLKFRFCVLTFSTLLAAIFACLSGPACGAAINPVVGEGYSGASVNRPYSPSEGRLDPSGVAAKKLSECCLLAREFGVTERDLWGDRDPESSLQVEGAGKNEGPFQESDGIDKNAENQQTNAEKDPPHKKSELDRGKQQAGKDKPKQKKQQRRLSSQEKKLVRIPKTEDPDRLLVFARKLESYRSGSTSFSVARARSLRTLGKTLSLIDPKKNRQAHFFGRFLNLKYDPNQVDHQTIDSASNYLIQKGVVENADAKLCICLLMSSKEKELLAYAAESFAKQLKNVPEAEDPKKISRLIRRFEGLVRFHRLVGNPMKLSGTDAEGEQFNLKELQGKTVLVHFWTLNCNACEKEISSLKHLQGSLKEKGLRILGVSADRNETKVYQYLQKHDINWKNLVSDGVRNPAIEFYGVVGAPTYILVGEDGSVVATSNSLKKMKPVLERVFPEN